MDLIKIQKKVGEIRRERGFTMDPSRIFTLLVEEVGEVARELKSLWSVNYSEFESKNLEDELADVMILIIGLANQFDIDLENSIESKILKDEGREWKSRTQN